VRAIDTNIAARLLMQDDPKQSPKAREIVAEGVLVPATVLLELSWLLESRYRLPRREVHILLATFIAADTVSLHEREQVEWALERYGEGAPFADMLHVSAAAGASSFVTFDKDIPKHVGPKPPVPIEYVKG
jgi:predicted nucleic-acid-binding protein